MKTKLQILFVALMTLSAVHNAAAQGTAFTYQGQLQNNGSLASGTYDFTFSLYNAASGGTVIAGPVNTNGVGVTNGLFLVTLDFGASVWNGATNWLQIAVATNGSSTTTITSLAPLQQITPVPQAIFATTASNLLGTLAVSQLNGTVSLTQLPSTVVTQSESGVTLGSLTVSGLELPSPILITSDFGSLLYSDQSGNFAGGLFSYIASGSDNTVIGGHASVPTGSDDTVMGYYAGDGGSYNTAVGWEAMYFASGNYNTAFGYDALHGNVTGTYNICLGVNAGGNYASTETDNIDIGYAGNPGESKIIHLGNDQTDTYLTGNVHAPGGLVVDGAGLDNGSFASGWSLSFGGNPGTTGEGIGSVRASGDTDSFGLNFYTDFNKRLTILNNGNVGIGTSDPANLLQVAGAISCVSISITSDRGAKEGFAAVDPRSVLEKVSSLPVTEWKYKADAAGLKHIGPMAQDFQAAFGLNGADDTHISVVDEGGVALAAIQGLNQKLEEENAELQQQNDALAKQLNDLARVVRSLADAK